MLKKQESIKEIMTNVGFGKWSKSLTGFFWYDMSSQQMAKFITFHGNANSQVKKDRKFETIFIFSRTSFFAFRYIFMSDFLCYFQQQQMYLANKFHFLFWWLSLISRPVKLYLLYLWILVVWETNDPNGSLSGCFLAKADKLSEIGCSG